MNEIFSKHLQKMNRTKSLAYAAYVGLSVCRAFAIGATVVGIWNTIDPMSPLLSAICGLVAFITILQFSSFAKPGSISSSSLLLSLDMQYPAAKVSPFLAASMDADQQEWGAKVAR